MSASRIAIALSTVCLAAGSALGDANEHQSERPFASFALSSGGELAQDRTSQTAPQYTAAGNLKLPLDYRQWMYVSTGFGMSYGANTDHREPVFDNVFVQRAAYDHFIKTRTWPDRTMFVLELRQSSNHGSILRDGRFQGAITSIEASVKDTSRFPEKWAYFDFGAAGTEAAPFPKEARCFSCHKANGAVDNTFVQFYPTLLGTVTKTGASPK